MGVGDLTPAMRQYLEVKRGYPDGILLFRMGDFYEMFFDDALRASKILEITLTTRNKNSKDAVPMCGFPYHAASSYIAKLIDGGNKVAICEQVEDPKLAKGVVKREVVRVVTPGLLLEDENLSAKENNFLAAVAFLDGKWSLAFVDISTGEFWIFETVEREAFLVITAHLEIRELLISEDFQDEKLIASLAGEEKNRCLINRLSRDYFEIKRTEALLTDHFSQGKMAEITVKDHRGIVSASGALLSYMFETQKSDLDHINAISWYKSDDYLVLDGTAGRNLELFASISDGKKKDSLFGVLDETLTSPGGRRLRWWLGHPLRDPLRIRERLAAVLELKEFHLLRGSLRSALKAVYDMERLGSRIAVGIANGRDLAALKASLEILPQIRDLLAGCEAPLLKTTYNGMDEMVDLRELIENAVVDDPPFTVREGGIIREGYDQELDALISATREGRKWIAALEEKERRKTGINSLKVGFNNVFGYYIEVTKANAGMVPADYIRKQTLVGAERYINEELKGYEETVLHAEEHRREREYELFVKIRDNIAKEIIRIQTTASRIADLDALASLAEVAERNSYCCPIVDDGDSIEMTDGRHPVVEKIVGKSGFVPNDILLDLEKNRFLIVTGPNMAGKSTYIRQVALIVLMAQMGSFVPAAKARIGVVDRIFTRIGAVDNLARGQSTFMVEMNEVADILRNATNKSLIILDEVGRGTSTFDGLSIAWAVAEHIHDSFGARTLFATHYHELTELAATKEGIRNFNVAVREWGDKIIFLRKIVEGGANRSYGIEVARLAGVPEEVVSRAKEILANLENGEIDEAGIPKIAKGKKTKYVNENQLSLFKSEKDAVLEKIKGSDVMNMTPLMALQNISDWKKRLERDNF
jgi:DNA mismatch repair protein MutS